MAITSKAIKVEAMEVLESSGDAKAVRTMHGRPLQNQIPSIKLCLQVEILALALLFREHRPSYRLVQAAVAFIWASHQRHREWSGLYL